MTDKNRGVKEDMGTMDMTGRYQSGARETGGRPALLECRSLETGFGTRRIVCGIDLDLYPGETVALLGLNGCGKTTLIKSLCGLINVQNGSCTVLGLDSLKMNERVRARYMAYIPQRGSLILGRTVTDVVLMGCNARLGLFDSPTSEQCSTARKILDRLGIAELADRDYASLSEGQKQLVILARTLMQDAPVMLMDEPDSALDHVNKSMVLGKIREAVSGRGEAADSCARTCLIALHDPNFAMRFCDRLLLMSEGRLTGEIVMSHTSCAELEEGMRSIYGDVHVITHEGRYVML